MLKWKLPNFRNIFSFPGSCYCLICRNVQSSVGGTCMILINSNLRKSKVLQCAQIKIKSALVFLTSYLNKWKPKSQHVSSVFKLTAIQFHSFTLSFTIKSSFKCFHCHSFIYFNIHKYNNPHIINTVTLHPEQQLLHSVTGLTMSPEP